MKKINKIIIFTIIILGFYYIETIVIKDNSIFNKIIFNEISNSNKNNLILKEIQNIFISKDENNIVSLLNPRNDDYIFENNVIASAVEKERTPLIYIYNTHDQEEYNMNGLENYNIEPNVKTASYILQEQLKKYNIFSIVEERSPTSEAKNNNLDYPYSYRYSRQFAMEAKEKYPSIQYFIDLHRDGVSREASTIEINNINYAKLMFVVGMEHENSNYNYELVKRIESYIEEKYPGILRSTHIREDDDFNQDIDNNAFLIEVGGNDNSIDEVYNSLVIFAESLSYISSGIL